MTAQGGALRSAWLRAPPQNRRVIFPMCYGVQFTSRRQDIYDSQHIFDRICDEHAIEHRLTKVNHPWTTDEVEQPLSARAVLFSDCPRVTA